MPISDAKVIALPLITNLVPKHALDTGTQPLAIRHNVPHYVGALPPVTGSYILLNLVRALEVHCHILVTGIPAASPVGESIVSQPHLGFTVSGGMHKSLRGMPRKTNKRKYKHTPIQDRVVHKHGGKRSDCHPPHSLIAISCAAGMEGGIPHEINMHSYKLNKAAGGTEGQTMCTVP